MEKATTYIDWYSLFGKNVSDPQLQSIIDPEDSHKFGKKSFKDADTTHDYYFSYEKGLSLSFKNEIFNSVFIYGKNDKKFKAYEGELPYSLNFDMRNGDVVGFFGEPNRKNGGRTVPISISYERAGIEFTFLSPVWEIADNRLCFICLFPKDSNSQNSKVICGLCGKDASSFCSQCNLVAYCSRECQSTHWKVHKVHCNPHFKK